ncbi:stage II sporulation protein E [Clostridium cylindrosporum]|nr:stage II sporulation protein E [Clostridium cylindrosporum]
MYKEELMTYKRVTTKLSREKGIVGELISVNALLFYTCAFFASRVIMLKMFMPFGLAFFISAYGLLGIRAAVATGFITAIGYISTFNGYLGFSHAVSLMLIMAIGLMIKKDDKFNIFRISACTFIINSLVNIFVYYKFISGSMIPYDILITLFESVIVVAFGFIFSYGVPVCFFKKNKKELTTEELVCMALIIAIAVAGTFDISYMGLSLKNIVAFTLALTCGFLEGATLGAAMGITLGLVSGIADTTMPFTIGVFGFCGLIAGVFKDFGKILASVAFILSAAILSFYTSTFADMQPLLIDSVVGTVIFLISPKRKLEKLVVFNNKVEYEKAETRSDLYLQRVNDVMASRLSMVSGALGGLSNVLEQSFTNQLSNKTDINAMVEQLADKVCFTCENRNTCWDSEIYHTSNSFIQLLSKVEKRGKISVQDIPDSLQKKCLRPHELTRQTNNVFEVFRINSRWRNKLANSRMVLAEQIRGVSSVVNTMVEEATNVIEIKNEKEIDIEDALRSEGLKFSEVFAVKSQKGRFEVIVYIDANDGNDVNVCNYTSVISKVLDRRLCTSNLSGAMVDNNIHQIKLVEEEKYTVKTAIAKLSRDEVSGDSYTFGDIGSGRYLVGLSDGMGSGAIASNESKATISLLEKFMEAGFDRDTAIKAINSVLILGDSDERFATIDMAILDLYNGIGEFVKIGAAPTYIKTSRGVEVLKSSSIPVGILDNVDFETNILEVRNGDMIIMVSDGVSDAKEDMKNDWVTKALSEYDSGNPKDVADYILKKAKSYVNEYDADDMTVIVSKVWKVI